MSILKKIAKYIIPLFAFTYLSLTPMHSSPTKSIQPIENPKSLYTLIQKEQKHNVQRGENLWVIAKQYLHENASDNEIMDKVKNIQELSNLTSNEGNDNQKYVNGKSVKGSDGLVDLIKPGQELIINKSYDIKYSPTADKTVVTYIKPSEKRDYSLLSAFVIPLAGIATLLLKKKIITDPPELSKRFNIRKVRESGLENKLNKLLKKGKTFSEVSRFIEDKAYMPISKSTYYRYRNIM